jgi:hypothetical protein
MKWRQGGENCITKSFVTCTSIDEVKDDAMGGNIARMGGRGKRIRYWRERQRERDHQEDQDVDG